MPDADDDEDDIPSFHSIVEEDLGGPPRPPVQWQGAAPVIPQEWLEKVLPHYERWEFLGAGGMGVVYKAWHRELQRWAAIKFLSPNQRRDPRAAARFQNEATVLAQLRHPNIVPVHDFGSAGDLAWLVMDFLDGVPLQQWARAQPRKPAEIARMMARIARAVGVAHASGITHRDLKPGNILVQGDEPVLLDFGLAQNINWQHEIRLTQAGELAGTVAYLSPEQVQPSLGEPAPATDVHACGVMLYEMLAGRLPRTGLATQIITRLHEDALPPRLRTAVKSVRSELDAICWRAMQKSPEDRYANGISLAEDLERFLDGRPVRAKNPDFLDISYHYLRRHPMVLAGAGLALLAVIMVTWSASRVLWSQKKASLLSQINRQLTEPDWTPARLKETEKLLTKMHEVDTVLERYVHEDVVTRTQSTVSRLLDAPRLSQDESAQVEQLLAYLAAKQHPKTASLLTLWQAREAAWKPVVSLETPVTTESAGKVFENTGWSAEMGEIKAASIGPRPFSAKLSGTTKLTGAVELEMVFGENWSQGPLCGVDIRVPARLDFHFHIIPAEQFAAIRPHFDNPAGVPVMAILSGTTPLVYAVLPQNVRRSPRLTLRCRYENGDLSLALNDAPPLHYTRIFELARPLDKAAFHVLLPGASSLVSLEVRRRQVTAPASPLVKADDLVSSGQPEEALDIYEKYLNRADVKGECLYKYGVCLDILRQTKQAFAAWEQAAQNQGEPWKSLAMFQLWRGRLTQGQMESANAWFDLLMAGDPPEVVRSGVLTEDRLMLNQHYVPLTRSLNSLKAGPKDMAALDRAVRVQQFLGADDRDIALRTAMAFHYAGSDVQARHFLRQAVVGVRPSASLSDSEIHSTLICLDQWSALGDADDDAVFQAALASWLHVMRGNPLPIRAVVVLEDIRHDLRRGKALTPVQRKALAGVADNPRVLMRHRLEACLISGEAETTAELRRRARKKAVLMLASDSGKADTTQQRLTSEFVIRSLDGSWTLEQATEWITMLVGKARPLVTQKKWVGPMVQSVVSMSLADIYNQMFQSEEGRRFARDYILRNRPARELVHAGMHLFLMTVFCQGTGLPFETPEFREAATQIVPAYCSGEFTEVAFMQLFTLWNGIKNPATWELMAFSLKPALRQSLAKILVKRYEKLGQPEKAAEFLAFPPALERPMSGTTRQDLSSKSGIKGPVR